MVRLGSSEGEFSIFEVVSEQRRLIEAQSASNQALSDYYSALAELERAVGKALP